MLESRTGGPWIHCFVTFGEPIGNIGEFEHPRPCPMRPARIHRVEKNATNGCSNCETLQITRITQMTSNDLQQSPQWMEHFLFRQRCWISGNSQRSWDTAPCTHSSFWCLSASNRLTSAANIRFTRNAPQSRQAKIFRATLSSKISVNGDNEICFSQQAIKWVIAPGLRAQNSSKGLSKMHLPPQGSKFRDQSGQHHRFYHEVQNIPQCRK